MKTKVEHADVPPAPSTVVVAAAATGQPTGQALIAVDAGFTSVGWAVLVQGRIIACGCIRTERSPKKRAVRVADDDAERCAVIARQIAEVIRKHHVKGMLAELPSSGAKAARAMACMARAGAILATVAELLELPAAWVTPQEVKQIAGRKDASKDDVERAVLVRWPDAPLPKAKGEREHVADALAAYLAAEHGNLVRLLNGGTAA